jgi:glutathione-regulated potassium-efflux system ancillary protein KefF
MPPTAMPARILILLAHPNLRLSRVNRSLAEAARQLAGDTPGQPHVEVRDLYALYPDYAIDVAAEQASVAQADLIVWLHPIQWYSMPALMKLWLDDVLTHDWAYGRHSSLQGKDLWLVTSTGGPESAYCPSGYNRFFFDAFLPPYEQTAALCGMRFLPPLVAHGAHALSAAELAAHIEIFRQRLTCYPQWPELDELAQCLACAVPQQDRPLEEAA